MLRALLLSALVAGCAPVSLAAHRPVLRVRDAPDPPPDMEVDIDRWLDRRERRPAVRASPIHVEYLPFASPADADLRAGVRGPINAPEIAPSVHAFRRCALDCAIATELVLMLPRDARVVAQGALAQPVRGAFTFVRLPLEPAETVAASVLVEVPPAEGDDLAAPQSVGAELIASGGGGPPLFTVFAPHRETVAERAIRSSIRARVRDLLESEP